jgi:hypothetical protein
LIATTRGDARHWLRHLEIPPSLGNSSRYPARWKEPGSNDPFLEADLAVIIMNCFVIALMLAPPTKGSSEILVHRLRKHPIINTSSKRIEIEVE